MGGLPRRRLTALGSDERGQSVFDFAIGVSLFLIVVIGVLVTIPTAFGALDSDAGASSSDRVAADRVADFLTETAFAGPKQSDRLESDCVRDFFQTAADPPNCGYFDSALSLSENVGLSESRAVNVTIRAEKSAVGDRGLELLCWDEADNRYISAESADCAPDSTADISLYIGSRITNNDDYATARRVAQLGDETVHVIVRTW